MRPHQTGQWSLSVLCSCAQEGLSHWHTMSHPVQEVAEWIWEVPNWNIHPGPRCCRWCAVEKNDALAAEAPAYGGHDGGYDGGHDG
eukprot:3193352-Pyramimonas_sp.AAC.1